MTRDNNTFYLWFGSQRLPIPMEGEKAYIGEEIDTPIGPCTIKDIDWNQKRNTWEVELKSEEPWGRVIWKVRALAKVAGIELKEKTYENGTDTN